MKKASALSAAPWPLQLTPLIDDALERFLPRVDTQPEPLHRAMRHAVFSGGKRLRPQFLLKVAQVCGAKAAERDLLLRAACAVELVHAAWLVHDDLPSFDNAAQRRGCPTLHVLFGEARALLATDALIARSFELVATVPRSLAARALRLVQLLAVATGSNSGLLGGPGFAQEALGSPRVPGSAEVYHVTKTGALFAVAAEAAAVATGSRHAADWAAIGWLVGKGYQLAHSLTALPPLAEPHAAERLRVQLAELSTTLHQRIAVLTTAPQPLLQFLDELCAPLLKPGDARPATSTPNQPLYPDAEGV